jgi:hypothetical protein
MSYASWDPESGGSLSIAEVLPLDTIPIEALTLYPSGSTVDLLEILPPKAAETNYGGVLTLLPDVPQITSSVYQFTVTRTGWYNLVIPEVRVQGLGSGLGTMYDCNLVLSDNLGAIVAADNRAIVAGALSSLSTRLSCYGYLTKDVLYSFQFKFSQASTVLPPADPPILLGGTMIWPNVYIFPIISGIDAFGSSNFVVFP